VFCGYLHSRSHAQRRIHYDQRGNLECLHAPILMQICADLQLTTTKEIPARSPVLQFSSIVQSSSFPWGSANNHSVFRSSVFLYQRNGMFVAAWLWKVPWAVCFEGYRLWDTAGGRYYARELPWL